MGAYDFTKKQWNVKDFVGCLLVEDHLDQGLDPNSFTLNIRAIFHAKIDEKIHELIMKT